MRVVHRLDTYLSLGVCIYIYVCIHTGAFFILFCFQEIIAPAAGACLPYLLDSEDSAWSIFYMTGLYFRTDEPYIILIDLFFFLSPSQIEWEGWNRDCDEGRSGQLNPNMQLLGGRWVWLCCPLVWLELR